MTASLTKMREQELLGRKSQRPSGGRLLHRAMG